jgi:hypothetical protein
MPVHRFPWRSCAALDLLYHTLPRARGGRGQHTEKEAAEENTTERNWSEFYKRIEVRGDSESSSFKEQPDNPSEWLSDEESQDLVAKLESMSFRAVYPRGMRSVVRDAFMITEAIDWKLNHERAASAPWRTDAALHLYQFAQALQRISETARELEKQTGYSGRALAEE